MLRLCLLDHGVIIGRGQSWDANKRLGLVFIVDCGSVGHRSEGQLVMLQNGEAVVWLLLLQVEHLPQLLQLLQLAEGLQHHQHDDQTQDQVNSDAHFVELPEPLVSSFSRYVVTQADGAQGDEAEVEGLQEVPVLLQRREDGGGDEEEARDGHRGEQRGVNDGHQRLGQAPAHVDVHDRPPRAEHHDPLHHGGEEEEGEGDADHRVDDAEGLPAVRQRRCVTITCSGQHGAGEKQGRGEVPVPVSRGVVEDGNPIVAGIQGFL